MAAAVIDTWNKKPLEINEIFDGEENDDGISEFAVCFNQIKVA